MYENMYDMTLFELINTIENYNKGLAYELWKHAVLIGRVFSDKFPKTPEEASPELYPPKKRYKMPSFLIEKAKKRGMI